MKGNSLKVLLISDLHAVMEHCDNRSDSFLIFKSNGSSDFFDGFVGFLKDNKLIPDLIVCAGDISNKGSFEAFSHIWKKLKALENELNTQSICCVPGNHDLSSRLAGKTDFDPKYYLQFSEPSFPSERIEDNTHFWAWHWFCRTSDNYNSIMINTSAYHGYKDEYSRGRIAPNTTEQIRKFIESEEFKERPINFVVCHHHPRKMEHVEFGSDYEAIDGGEGFLDMLSRTGKGPWVLLHGHKHWPQLQNGTGDIVMISSGSLSANIHDEIKESVSNTFCFIDFDLSLTEEKGIPVGTYRAFEYFSGMGWKKSQNERMPGIGGFGSNATPRTLARKIKEELDKEKNFLRISEIPEIEKEIVFMLPLDIRSLKKELERMGVEAIEGSDGTIFDQFGMKI